MSCIRPQWGLEGVFMGCASSSRHLGWYLGDVPWPECRLEVVLRHSASLTGDLRGYYARPQWEMTLKNDESSLIPEK